VSDQFDFSAVDRFVGACIADRRVELGLTQAELGRRIGVTFQQVQKYESGANRVSASRLFLTAEVLRTPVADFFPDSAAHMSSAVVTERPPGLMAPGVMRSWSSLSRCQQRLVQQIVEALADHDGQ
jgi:transcriptional regulator with XRE-family HTH domain